MQVRFLPGAPKRKESFPHSEGAKRLGCVILDVSSLKSSFEKDSFLWWGWWRGGAKRLGCVIQRGSWIDGDFRMVLNQSMPPKKTVASNLKQSHPAPRRGFFKTLRDSIYSPAFYEEIPSRSLGKAIVYLFQVLGLILTVFLIGFVGVFEWKLKPFLQENLPALQAVYPEELEITLQDGQIYTNVEEPYFIEFPDFGVSADLETEYLFVIDTKTPFSVKQMREYDVLGWLTLDGLVLDTQTRTEVFPVGDLKEGTLNKRVFDEGLSKILEEMEGWVIPTALIGGVSILLIYGVFQLGYGLFLALLVWFVSSVMQQQWTYAQSYKAGLHAMTLPLFIDAGLFWIILLSGRSMTFPFLFTLLSLIVIGFNLWPNRKIAHEKE